MASIIPLGGGAREVDAEEELLAPDPLGARPVQGAGACAGGGVMYVGGKLMLRSGGGAGSPEGS